MNNIAENTAQDAAQSLKPPAVGETNAAAEKSPRAQNTGSKARQTTKKLNLTQKIIEIKKQVAGVPMLRIEAKELTAAELNELLAIAPLSEIRAEAAELTAPPSDALLSILTDVGIDWRIVSEKATRKDANGSEEFCRAHRLTQSNASLWVYESTIELLLINVDNVAETERTEIHAIGTSKSTANEARAAAWRSCLLSFFASRFNAPKIAHTASIDGIGETPADAQNAANSPQTGGQGGKEEPRPLSDAQMKRLYRKAEAAGYTEQDAVARILEKYDKTNPALMTRQEYDEICHYYDDQKQPIGR
jgi:hypothetical protein